MRRNFFRVGRSPVAGRGVFAIGGFNEGDVIGRAKLQPVIAGERKPNAPYCVQDEEDGSQSYMFGPLRFLNHQRPANADLFDDGTVVALGRIRPGDEIVIDYGHGYEPEEIR